jgi:hypothetical protein
LTLGSYHQNIGPGPCTIFAFENQSYLGEFDAKFKKALGRESGAQGVLFDEKNRGSKSLRCAKIQIATVGTEIFYKNKVNNGYNKPL